MRATISTFNALQHARYQAYLRGARTWIDAEAAGADEEERLVLFDVCIKWATVLAALVRLEERTIDRNGQLDEPWTTVDAPATWRTIDGFLEDVPADLAAALYATTLELNPGLFGLANDENTKKNGGISVG